jgi:GTP cyclohydrolase I
MSMVTSHMLGAFRADQATRREFLAIIGSAARTPVGHV